MCSHSKLTEIEKCLTQLISSNQDYYDFMPVKVFLIQPEHVVAVVEKKKEKSDDI